MLTDTHCHILPSVYYNYEKIIESLANNNIKRIIVNGYNYETNKEVINLCKKYNNVYGALGHHPDYIDNNVHKNIEFIKQNLKNEKIIAIGEVGLDYFHNDNNKDNQKNILKIFLELSEKEKLPLIIHNRNATNDLLELLKKYHTNGIIHCFSGSIETAREYLKLGYKLGINGLITFKNTNLKETLIKLPLDSFLLETDSPYITPVPLRGLPNEPANLNIIAKTIAELKKVGLETLTTTLESNFFSIFDIKD